MQLGVPSREEILRWLRTRFPEMDWQRPLDILAEAPNPAAQAFIERTVSKPHWPFNRASGPADIVGWLAEDFAQDVLSEDDPALRTGTRLPRLLDR